MPLIVDGVCRYTFNGLIMDRPFANIMDMQIDTTGSTASRGDAIYDCAGNMLNAWVSYIAPRVVGECSLTSISWTDLDSLTGVTGERSSTSETTLPVSGGASSATSPGSVSVLVTKQTQSQRGARNGRWYQTGISEDAAQGQNLGTSVRDAWQTAFDSFLTQINDEPFGVFEYEKRAVVVHTTADQPDIGTFTAVEALNVGGRLATQRRRLRA